MIRQLTFLCFLVCVSSCTGIYQGKQKRIVQFSQPNQNLRGEAWCEMCVLVMDRVQAMIKEKESEGKINQTLREMCDMIQGAMKQECYMMIPIIESQIKKGISPEKQCEAMSLCGAGSESLRNLVNGLAAKLNGKPIKDPRDTTDAPHPSLDFNEILEFLAPKVTQALASFNDVKNVGKDSIQCKMCKAVFGTVDRGLDKYKLMLVNYAEEICGMLPNPTQQACSDAMAYYIPLWWDDVFHKITSPDEICYKIGLCTRET